MNVNLDIVIPALVFAAGCLAVAIWALWDKGRMKAQHETLVEDYATACVARNNFKKSLETCQGERDRLQAKVEAQNKAIGEQAERNAAVVHELLACKEERDGLQKQLKEATEARSRSRRKKTEAEVMGHE